MLDITNLQGGFYPAFANGVDSSNPCIMEEGLDFATIRANLKRAMERTGWKATTLSQKVSPTNKTLVKNLLEKNNDVQISTLSKLASVMNVALDELLASPRVPIVGYIGAGGTIIFEEYDFGEMVLRPPQISGRLEALIVRGDSMLPRYKDGDIIYIQRQHDGLLEDYIGEDCAVRLVSGETYLKQIIKGSTDGRFTLISLNAAPMTDVEVEWATPVTFVMPARSRHLFG